MIIVLVEKHCDSVVERRWDDGYMRSGIGSNNGACGWSIVVVVMWMK